MRSFLPKNAFGSWLVYEALWLAGARRFAAINVGFQPVDADILADPDFVRDASQIQLYAELCKFSGSQDWSGDRVLEAGCGTGRSLSFIQRHYRPAQLVGFDFSAVAVARARLHGLDVRRASADAMPFADASFDCLLSVDCLGPFPAAAFLREAARILAPGGKVLIGEYRPGPADKITDFLRGLSEQAGLRLTRFLDASPGVLAALEKDNARKSRLIAHLPRTMRLQLAETLSLKGSDRYRKWESGEMRYYFAMLEHQ